MPGKGKPQAKASTENTVAIQTYCDVLKGIPAVNEATGKPIRKAEAALQIWSYASGAEAQREEIFKSQCIANLLAMLDRGDLEEKHAAIGAVSALAQSEKHLAEVVNNKVIVAAAATLADDNDRTKVPAAILLHLLAQRPEYAVRTCEAGLLAMLEVLKQEGPGWGQLRQAQYRCVAAIKLLIENVQAEAPELKHGRRLTLVQAGAVPCLLRHVAYAPRTPPPATVPAALTVGKKKPPKDGRLQPPQGQKDRIATAAAACLRFLALCPGFVEDMLNSGHLPKFVAAVLTANEEQCAYVCGVLWEVTAEAEVGQKVLACAAVPALLHAIAQYLPYAASSKKGKGKGKGKGKKGEANGGDKKPSKTDKKNEGPPPPCYPDICVCNAAGALHHLTFLDEAKLQVGKHGGMAILTACLKLGNTQTYENAVGALWNCGLDINNSLLIEAAGAPEFLAKPVPDSWKMDGRAGEQLDGAPSSVGASTAGPSFFITQVQV